MSNFSNFKRNMKIMYQTGGKKYVGEIITVFVGLIFLNGFCLLLYRTSEKGDYILLDYYPTVFLPFFVLLLLGMFVIYFVQYFRVFKPIIEEEYLKVEAENRFKPLLSSFNKKSNQ